MNETLLLLLYTMRHRKAILLLSLFCISQLLVLLQVTSLQWHKFNMTERVLNSRSTTTLQFNVSTWSQIHVNSKNEILWKGKMFDIKQIVKKGNQIILYGHYDKHEDHLLDQLTAGSQKKNSNISLSFSWCALFFESPTIYNFYSSYAARPFYAFTKSTLMSAMKSQLEEPPQV